MNCKRSLGKQYAAPDFNRIERYLPATSHNAIH